MSGAKIIAEKIVGVPTMQGIGTAFKDWGIGLLAGIAFLFASRLFGGLGLIAAPLLVGSMLKDDRGKMIAVLVGFMAAAMGGLALTNNSGSNGNEETM